MTNCSFQLQPLAQNSSTTQDSFKNLLYTNQDFYSLKFRIRNFIMEKFQNDFTDFIESDMAFLLIEPQAFLFDTLSFKQDQLVNEIFLSTVTELDNAIRIAGQVGFKPTPPLPAVAMFSATINTALPADLIIPNRVAVETSVGGQSITYELFPADANNDPIFNQDIIIPAGELSNTTIVGVEGRTFVDNFSGNGLSGQNYQLTNNPVIYGSIIVTVDGATWNQVEYFTDSLPRQEYRVEYDSSYNAYIIFGNTSSGLFPSVGSAISVSYRVGGGTDGNIVSGAISTYRGYTLDGFGIVSQVNFTNYTQSNGGYNGDSIQDIKNKLPAYLAMQNRIVSASDYVTFADQFFTPYNGQIGKSTVALRNYGCAGNIVDVYILALKNDNDLQIANDSLKAALTDAIETNKMMGVYVCIKDGVIVSTDVSIDVILKQAYRSSQSDIQALVTQRVNNFFSLYNWDYGQTLNSSDLIMALSGINQVDSFTITFTTDDPNNSGSVVSTKYYEIIRPNTITITFIFE